MKRIKKVATATFLLVVLSLGSVSANAGIIVNYDSTGTETPCVDSKTITKTGFDHGVIVNFTGVIVNFTGVIVNLTGVIVNFADTKDTTCGHIPTSD